MHSLLSMIFKVSFITAVIRDSTPILFATLGAVIASKAGAINIGIEGTMLTSALMGVIFSAYTGSAWIGILAAIASGMIISIVMWYFVFKLNTNIILTGIAINIISSGGTTFLLSALTGDKGISTSLHSKVLPNINIPIINSIPVVGKIISGQNIVVYVGIICVILIEILFNKTSLGLRIKAVGEAPEAAESVGIPVVKIKFIALMLSCILSAIGGAYLSMGYVSWFSTDMTSGRGYIALAAREIAGNTGVGSLFASLLFGASDTLANYFQKLKVPVELVQMLPYIITIIGFIVLSIVHDKKEKARKQKSIN